LIRFTVRSAREGAFVRRALAERVQPNEHWRQHNATDRRVELHCGSNNVRRLKDTVRASGLRADTAYTLVDFAMGQSIFTVRQVERHLDVSYARANKLVQQLMAAGVLAQYDDSSYSRRFTAPALLRALTA
jgi:hypothetical protein